MYFTNKAKDIRIFTVNLSITKKETDPLIEKWTYTALVYGEIYWDKILELRFKISYESTFQ